MAFNLSMSLCSYHDNIYFRSACDALQFDDEEEEVKVSNRNELLSFLISRYLCI